MNILVTGAAGFVGRHLVKELQDNNHNVFAAVNNGEHLDDGVTTLMANLAIREQVEALNLRNIEAVIHLAGLAAVAASYDDPQLYIETNSSIQTNLFETFVQQDIRPKVLVISSGSLYDPRAEMPINEESSVSPTSPYAVSKITQEAQAHYYRHRGFETVVARPFNHTGPGQREGFIVPDFAKQIVEAKLGNRKSISVGNLSAERDYTDVRDITRAYRLLIESDIATGTYNICSGKSYSGQSILDKLLELSGVTIEIVEDPARMRPAEIPKIYGDHSKLTKDTNWNPEISLEQTLQDALDDWQSQLSS